MNNLKQMSYQELEKELANVDKKIECIEKQIKEEKGREVPAKGLIAWLESESEKTKSQRDAIKQLLQLLDEIKEAGQNLWDLALEVEKLGGNSTKMSDAVNEFSQAYIKMRCKLMKELDNLV